jgi:hypothetical protein
MVEGTTIDRCAEGAERMPVGVAELLPVGELDAQLVGGLVFADEISLVMLRNRSASMMGGMVASPTPTVPISGDSITVIAVPVPGSDAPECWRPSSPRCRRRRSQCAGCAGRPLTVPWSGIHNSCAVPLTNAVPNWSAAGFGRSVLRSHAQRNVTREGGAQMSAPPSSYQSSLLARATSRAGPASCYSLAFTPKNKRRPVSS